MIGQAGFQEWSYNNTTALGPFCFLQVFAGYIAMLIGDSKWLFLWVRHWVIHSNYSFKNVNSFRNKSSDCPYEGFIVSFTQPICSLWLCLELFLLAAQNSSKMTAQVTRNTVFKMFPVLTCLLNCWKKSASFTPKTYLKQCSANCCCWI